MEMKNAISLLFFPVIQRMETCMGEIKMKYHAMLNRVGEEFISLDGINLGPLFI